MVRIFSTFATRRICEDTELGRDGIEFRRVHVSVLIANAVLIS